ncbi:MAG: response regulator [Bacteroidetes bacterium]|nr:response regulator [Bacteroidota bacterium]
MADKSYKLFLVDDDEMVLTSLENHLKNHSQHRYELHKFPTGEAALEKMDIKPDIVILDYFLDSVDQNAKPGIEILKQMKQIDSNLPVVMLTKEDSIEIATETVRSGAYDYVIKNDTAYYKVQNNINNIVKAISLKHFVGLQKKYTWAVVISLVLMIVYITFFHGNLFPGAE